MSLYDSKYHFLFEPSEFKILKLLVANTVVIGGASPRVIPAVKKTLVGEVGLIQPLSHSHFSHPLHKDFNKIKPNEGKSLYKSIYVIFNISYTSSNI